jgi:hypothetical protein
MEYDKTDIILVGFVVLVLLWGASSYPFSSEPETPKYTAEIEMQEDNMILVVTSKVGEINADKLWVEFECLSTIEISNRSRIEDDRIWRDTIPKFEYDPTKTFEGDYYSISGGGEKQVSTYNIHVYVYYSYEDQDKLIKEKIIKYENPSVPFSTEAPEYTAEIERRDDNKIMVKTINHAEINAARSWVEFECPSTIEISNKNGIGGAMIWEDATLKYVFEYDPTKTVEGDYYSTTGGGRNAYDAYNISVYVYYSYEDQDKLIKEEIIEYKNPNR